MHFFIETVSTKKNTIINLVPARSIPVPNHTVIKRDKLKEYAEKTNKVNVAVNISNEEVS